MDKTAKREVKLTLWLQRSGYAAIVELAAAEDRSVSAMGRILLAEAIRARAARGQ